MTEQTGGIDAPPSLVVRIRDARDAESWNTFVAVYTPLIYWWCRARGLQDADATDITQDVLFQVARSIRSFEYQPERGRFRDWLGTVTRNKLLRFLEKNGRRPTATGGEQSQEALHQVLAPEGASEWENEFNAQILTAALERTRQAFEPATWRAFERVWLESAPAADVARELQMHIDAVYVAKSRVLKRLREEVRLLADDLPTW